MCCGKGRELCAMPVDGGDLGQMPKVDIESLGVDDLGYETDIGESRFIAEAKWGGLDQLLNGIEPALQDPMAIPAVDILAEMIERVLQIVEHAQIVQRMNVAGNRKGNRTRSGPQQRVIRDQARLGKDLLEIFDDHQRLSDDGSIVKLERRQEGLRIAG